MKYFLKIRSYKLRLSLFIFITASHVRRVRVPSQASDVDQFLDDLFNPVLDGLSDARSIAPSTKGGTIR